jgi:hypothetical protein
LSIRERPACNATAEGPRSGGTSRKYGHQNAEPAPGKCAIPLLSLYLSLALCFGRDLLEALGARECGLGSHFSYLRAALVKASLSLGLLRKRFLFTQKCFGESDSLCKAIEQ